METVCHYRYSQVIYLREAAIKFPFASERLREKVAIQFYQHLIPIHFLLITTEKKSAMNLSKWRITCFFLVFLFQIIVVVSLKRTAEINNAMEVLKGQLKGNNKFETPNVYSSTESTKISTELNRIIEYCEINPFRYAIAYITHLGKADVLKQRR